MDKERKEKMTNKDWDDIEKEMEQESLKKWENPYSEFDGEDDLIESGRPLNNLGL